MVYCVAGLRANGLSLFQTSNARRVWHDIWTNERPQCISFLSSRVRWIIFFVCAGNPMNFRSGEVAGELILIQLQRESEKNGST